MSAHGHGGSGLSWLILGGVGAAAMLAGAVMLCDYTSQPERKHHQYVSTISTSYTSSDSGYRSASPAGYARAISETITPRVEYSRYAATPAAAAPSGPQLAAATIAPTGNTNVASSDKQNTALSSSHNEIAPAPSPSTRPMANSASAALEDAIAGIDEDIRYVPTTRPEKPVAQHPPEATTQNVDTGKPPHEWQRFTDDWFGLRPKLDDKGLSFNGSFAFDAGGNMTGGQRRGGGAAYLLNVNLTADTEKLFNLKGGTFFANFRRQDALQNAPDGAYQPTSHLVYPSRTQISEIWYEQKLLDDKLRIKLGKIDAGTEFAYAPNAGEFLNGSAGFLPTTYAFPTDPDPAFGFNAFVYPTEHLYAGVGLYDGALAQGVPTGGQGPRTLFEKPSDLFLIGEAGVKWTSPVRKLDGHFGIGVWDHTGSLTKLDGTGKMHGTAGPYMILEQTLWRKHPDVDGDTQGVAGYLLYGWANPDVSIAEHSFSTGLTLTGPFDGRDEDVLGTGVHFVQFGDSAGLPRDNETSVELFYKIRALKWLSIKPDLQYIINPGGSGKDNALSGVIQFVIDL